MSKFLTKSVKKVTLLSVILAIILAAAIVVGTLFGFNKDATVKSNQTVTISTYKHNEAYLDDIKSDCEDIFEDKVLYEMESTVLFEDINEHVYVFSADADLEETVAALKAHFEARKNDSSDELCINDVVVNITWHKESNVSYLANGYVSRAIIASVIFAILAFVYVTLRFRRWDMGLLVALAIALGIGFTTALIALVRIPVTASTVYAVVGAGLLSAITAIMTLHRVRLASKEEDAKNKSAEEIVVSSIAWKEIVSLCAIVAIATVLVGVLVGKAGIWFALSALIGIVVSAFVGILYLPAVCVPLKGAVDAKIADKTVRYKGAEKTSTKVKKAAKKEEVAAEEEVVEEAPVEEPVEETEDTVEEVSVEETTEEENND
ncbi:MAG: hypothetical protein IJY05_04855 [Clostridia bacterium]|nr:hypothetical protein [Clostridia bacterium]